MDHPRGGPRRDGPRHRADRRPDRGALLPRSARAARGARPRARDRRPLRPRRSLDPVLPGVIWDDLPPADRTAAQAQDAAQDVLSRPEFHRPGPSIIERIERWISDGHQPSARSDQRRRRWRRHRQRRSSSPPSALVVVMLLRFGQGRADAMPGVPAARVRTGRGRTADDWRSEAAQLEAAGRWRAALRCRYRALVAELAGNGRARRPPRQDDR